MITEISYCCFVACGALRNPRLFSRPFYNQAGQFVQMKYYDSGHGQLSWSNALPAGPKETQTNG